MRGSSHDGVDATATLPTRAGAPGSSLYLHAFLAGGAVTAAIPARGQLVVGRAETCAVRLDDPSVSRRHARVRVEDEITVEDLGSHNGTRVNGELLAAGVSVTLRAGAVLEIGSVVVVLRPGKVTPLDPAAPTGPMARVEELASLVARSPISIVLLGETGVGKTSLARRIHEASARASGPFVSVNFTAVPEPLIESELFGHQRGAFTGATEARAGLIESAHGGTLFLDEIGDVPLSAQAKLLRVVESGELLRLGATRPTQIDVRYVSATNRDLKAAVAEGSFRADLFFRLDGISITVPPLRERPDEIASLARRFTRAAAEELGKPAILGDAAIRRLQAYAFPGNVRELKNVVTRSVLLARDRVLEPSDLCFAMAGSAAPRSIPPPPAGRDDEERARILDALDACAGNQSRASVLLGISRRTLVERLGRYGINRPRAKRPS